jgi:hypothetical protein
MTSSRVPSIRPRRPISGVSIKSATCLSFDPIVDQDGGARAVGFEIVEDGLPIIHRKQGPLNPHELTNGLFACRCTASGKVLLDAVVSDGRAWVCERLAHFGAKPLVVRRSTRIDGKG